MEKYKKIDCSNLCLFDDCPNRQNGTYDVYQKMKRAESKKKPTYSSQVTHEQRDHGESGGGSSHRTTFFGGN